MLQIERSESMNLLGLILANIIQKNLKHQGIINTINNYVCSINIHAGRMKANITFSKGEVVIRKGFLDNADAYVKGSLNAFIDLGLRRNILKRVLKGDVKIGGNIFKLLPLLKILSI